MEQCRAVDDSRFTHSEKIRDSIAVDDRSIWKMRENEALKMRKHRPLLATLVPYSYAS